MELQKHRKYSTYIVDVKHNLHKEVSIYFVMCKCRLETIQ